MGRGIITSSVDFFSDSFSCNKEMDHKSAVVYMNFVPPTYKKKKTFSLPNIEATLSKDKLMKNGTWFIGHDNGKCINY